MATIGPRVMAPGVRVFLLIILISVIVISLQKGESVIDVGACRNAGPRVASAQTSEVVERPRNV